MTISAKYEQKTHLKNTEINQISKYQALLYTVTVHYITEHT